MTIDPDAPRALAESLKGIACTAEQAGEALAAGMSVGVPTYRVHLRQTVSCAVTVEAEDEEAAIEHAVQAAPTTLCASCSGWGEQWSMDLSGEWETDRLPGKDDTSAIERIDLDLTGAHLEEA